MAMAIEGARIVNVIMATMYEIVIKVLNSQSYVQK